MKSDGEIKERISRSNIGFWKDLYGMKIVLPRKMISQIFDMENLISHYNPAGLFKKMMVRNVHHFYLTEQRIGSRVTNYGISNTSMSTTT